MSDRLLVISTCSQCRYAHSSYLGWLECTKMPKENPEEIVGKWIDVKGIPSWCPLPRVEE